MKVTHFSEQYFVLSTYFVLSIGTWHFYLQTHCRGVEFLYLLASNVNSLLCDANNNYMELVHCSENVLIKVGNICLFPYPDSTRSPLLPCLSRRTQSGR
jgi:hypothetical protein